MSACETDAWNTDETVAFISILKTWRDRNGGGTIGRVDWQYVAYEMSDFLRDDVNSNPERSTSELRDRFRKLKHDYFTARYRNRSCQYYNILADLFRNESALKMSHNDSELEEEAEAEVEQKYAHTVKLEHTDNNAGRRSPDCPQKQQRCRWMEGELEAFLDIITTMKLQAPLLRKRNAKVFRLISREMEKRRFAKRPDQLRIKYHQLRRQYAKAKRNGDSFDHYEEVHALLNNTLPTAESSGGELDSDTMDSGDEEADAHMASGTESEGALVSTQPSNRRCKWTESEVTTFLDMISSLGLQSALLRKRNAKTFNLLSKEMAKRSIDRPAEKLRIKFQQLRRQYNKANNGGESFEHYEAMHKLLNHKNNSNYANLEGNLSSGSDSEFNDSDEGDAYTSKRQGDSYFWSDHEVDVFLQIIKEHNLFRALDGSKKRNFKILAYISTILAKQSCQRTPHQLRNKLRLLLRRYHEVKKEGLDNVRMLPRHFEMLDDLVQKRRTPKMEAAKEVPTNAIKTSPKNGPSTLESDSEASSSMSSCDLLRAAAESENGEDTFEFPREPTPLEVLSSISEGQKQLANLLTSSHESFLRQQREMQSQFLKQMSDMMRQEREATFQMLRELMQSRH